MDDNPQNIEYLYDVYQYIWEITSCLIAHMSRDDDEWVLWGFPLCKHISDHYCLFYGLKNELNDNNNENDTNIQYQSSLNEICDQFRPLIGHGSSILITVKIHVMETDVSTEVTLNPFDDADYIILQDINSFLKSRLILIQQAFHKIADNETPSM